MPVYDHSYQTWQGQRRGPLFRWLAIPKFAYMDFSGQRAFTQLFVLSWLQFFLRLGYMYLLVNADLLKLIPVPIATLVPINAFFFKNMIDVQLPLCFIFAFMLGSGLIARDLRHMAVVLYASKPIGRWEYFAGKFSTLFLLFMLITGVQTSLLYLIQVIISPANSPWRLYFWKDYAWILPSTMLYALIISVTLSLMVLACSSLTKNPRYAGTILAAYIIGSGIVAVILRTTLDQKAFMALSPFYAGVDLGSIIFKLGNHELMGAGPAWTGILGVCAVCGLILKRRLGMAARYGR